MMNRPERYRIADVRRSYTADKARAEWHGEWAAALIYRPISIWITPLFLNAGISANAVSLGSLGLACSLPFVAVWSGPLAAVWVGLLAFLWVVLDCVDGNIARVTNSATPIGGYLDFLADNIFRVSLYGTIGYLADAAPGALSLPAGGGLALALVAVCLYQTARLCRYRSRSKTSKDVYKRDADLEKVPGLVSGMVFPFISGIDRLLPCALVITPFLDGFIWAIVIWLVVYGLIDFLYTQFAIVTELPR